VTDVNVNAGSVSAGSSVQLNEGAPVMEIDPSWDKTEIEELIPCGVGIATIYRDAAGNVMRQDYLVKVSPEALSMGSAVNLPT
jgi:hypothetical protein